MQSKFAFLDIGNFADLRLKNSNIIRTQVVAHVIHMFLDLLYAKHNCAKFHHCRICVTDFREKGLSSPPHIREQLRKVPS